MAFNKQSAIYLPKYTRLKDENGRRPSQTDNEKHRLGRFPRRFRFPIQSSTRSLQASRKSFIRKKQTSMAFSHRNSMGCFFFFYVGDHFPPVECNVVLRIDPFHPDFVAAYKHTSKPTDSFGRCSRKTVCISRIIYIFRRLNTIVEAYVVLFGIDTR